MKEHKTDMNIIKTDKYEKNWTEILKWSTKHMNITKYKKLNKAEHKTDMNITKIDKYKKNWTAILWRSTKHVNITEKLSSTFTKEH